MDDYATQFLGSEVTVTIDRSLGSKHPQHRYFYPFNYGFLQGTVAPDSHGVDAYVLGVFKPLTEFTGCCIMVVHRFDDDKLVVVPAGVSYSNEQIRALTVFQGRFFKSGIIRKNKINSYHYPLTYVSSVFPS